MSKLKQDWAALRQAEPKLRIRDAATRLGVGEAALLETRLGDGVARLSCEPARFFAGLPALGPVMLLARNDAAVHEKDVRLAAPTLEEERLHLRGETYAAVLDPAGLAFAYAVDDEGPKGPLQSVQFFDAAGAATIKVYARSETDRDGFLAFRTSLLAADQTDASAFRPVPPAPPAPQGAPALPPEAVTAVLEGAAAADVPIEIEVSNGAVRQRHAGAVHRIVAMGPWINVLDPGFDLHVNLTALAGADIEEAPAGARLLARGRDGGIAAILAGPAALAQWAAAPRLEAAS